MLKKNIFFPQYFFSRGKTCKKKNNPSFGKIFPLSECCSCCRVRVCRLSGDRSLCGKMANMGVLPGTVMDLICPCEGQRQCIVKFNGSTLSLDELSAAHIFVEPA